MHNDYSDDNRENAPDGDLTENMKGIHSYDEQDQNTEKISQTGEKELCREGKADGEEGKAASDQTEDMPKEDQVSSDEPFEKEKTDRVEQQSASVYYTPPYYVPNFTISNTQSTAGQNGGHTPYGGEPAPQPKKKMSSGVIVACVVGGLILSFLMGSFGGYLGALRLNSTKKDDVDPNTVTVTQNNGSIIVQEVLESDADMYTEVYSVVNDVADSVVEITTAQRKTHPFYGQYVTSGAGSGVIIAQTETTGIIVTNYHVIEEASDVTVRLTNGTEYAASYRGGDAAMDIAVLYITLKQGETLNCATLGDSSKLVVGQRVVAIGNPLGSLGGTVTDGIISALDRKINIDDNVMTLLQTNTAINPGNSGGGLFDMAGRLVGIVNAKQSAEGIEGLGFAIPINVIETAIASIAEHGYVQGRPSLGVQVTYVEQSYRYVEGLYVAKLTANDTPLREGDRILALNDTEIGSKLEYNAILGSFEIGSQVRVRIVRNGFERTETVTVTENTLNW